MTLRIVSARPRPRFVKEIDGKREGGGSLGIENELDFVLQSSSHHCGTVFKIYHLLLHGCPTVLVFFAVAYLRRKASTFLRVAIERWPRDVQRASLMAMLEQIPKTLLDVDANVRREGRHTFGAFVRRW